jgi:hypothetical protein
MLLIGTQIHAIYCLAAHDTVQVVGVSIDQSTPSFVSPFIPKKIFSLAWNEYSLSFFSNPKWC